MWRRFLTVRAAADARPFGFSFGGTMKFVKTERGMNEYHYVCEGCGGEGKLKVGVELQNVHCPADCGAMYVQWHNPITDQPDLMCVVCPVFDETEQAGAVDASPRAAQSDSNQGSRN